MDFQSVYDFWFKKCQPEDWFNKSDAFDEQVSALFTEVHRAAAQGELVHWRRYAQGALCEIIVLDQFSRNMFRDTPQAFAFDGLALCLAQHAIAKGFDQQLNEQERPFMYMPYMHSESKVIHQEAQRLFKPLANYEFEVAHKKIIDRFGRYPHRNAILGRHSSAEELAFLREPGSSF
ncbi:DUF924 family protein [Pseudoalteromonas sp. SSDWG2]|uniref:DUF924 family protein n=1 Tax=Pseudoalteromonas sp. SSDWG2 TaxID=3139391 RepID=UPI003BA8FF76